MDYIFCPRLGAERLLHGPGLFGGRLYHCLYLNLELRQLFVDQSGESIHV